MRPTYWKWAGAAVEHYTGFDKAEELWGFMYNDQGEVVVYPHVGRAQAFLYVKFTSVIQLFLGCYFLALGVYLMRAMFIIAGVVLLLLAKLGGFHHTKPPVDPMYGHKIWYVRVLSTLGSYTCRPSSVCSSRSHTNHFTNGSQIPSSFPPLFAGLHAIILT